MAARRPAPGGGTSAAWACALAAGLAEMSAAFMPGAPGRPGSAERMNIIRERASALRAKALDLAERELETYEPVLAAMRLDRADPGRDRAMRAALSAAAEAPLAIARTAAEVAELGAEAAAGGNEHLRGDAVTGVLLAEAACRSAAKLVELNLAGAPDDARRRQTDELALRASRARDDVLAHG